MKPKLKIGDKIIYKGTKCGKTDMRWEMYFGRYGIKKGDKGIIKETYLHEGGIMHYFTKDDKRASSTGYLYYEDFIIAKTWKEHYKNK